MKKLSVGQRIHARKSKHEVRCCSCWADSKTDDHLLRCPKRTRFRTEIYQLIKRLGQEMDPVLLEIMLDGVTKYLSGTRQKNTSWAAVGNSRQTIGIVYAKPRDKQYRQTRSTSIGNFKETRKQSAGTIYSAANLRRTGGNSTAYTTGNSRISNEKKTKSNGNKRK